jgi:TonB-dependent SusC/RagA subfamily outer membrane receptor
MQLTAHGKAPLYTGQRKLSKKIGLIMKMTAALLLIASLQVSARSIGQTMTASFKNASLNEVFKEVEKQTGYSFVFSRVQLQNAGKVTASFTQVSVQQALKLIFRDQPLTFQISDKFIVVQEKTTAKFADSIAQTYIPPGTVRGKVTDEAGKPVPGASVLVKGTRILTFTNDQGEFTLTEVSADAILVISAINIETREVALKGRSELTLVTKAKIYALEEVNIGVINSGYQTISKERAAGAYSTVSAKELSKTPAISIADRIDGLVPGVKINPKNKTIQVRSTNNYTFTSEPLIVIDGFPQVPIGDVQSLTKIQSGQSANNALFSYINPDDIEQITFLKDASATSIWGSKGANGVIVIETKKGKRNAPGLSFTSSIGISKPANLDKLAWMNAAEYVNFEQELVDRKFLTDPATATGTAALYTANNSEATEWMFKYLRGTATLAERDAALAAIAARDNKSQIRDYLLQNAVSQQYSMSVSGGSDNSTYYVSGGYTNDKPVFRSNNAQSASLTANITSDLFKKTVTFRAGINYLYAKNKSNLSAMDALSVSTTALRPYDMLVDDNGNTIQRAITMRPEVAAGLVSKGYLPFSYNAVDELNYSSPVSKENRVRITAGLNIKIIPSLNLDLQGMIQTYSQNMSSINELNSYSSRQLVNIGTTIVNNKLVYGVPYGGTYYLSDNNGYDYNFRSQLNFSKRFSGDHQVTALAAAEIRETYFKSYSATRYGYNSDLNTAATIQPNVSYNTMYGWSQSLSDPLSALGEKKSRYLSYLSNASYSFKDKYIATASIRFDDYTFLGLERSKRARPFWSAGLRWNASKDLF